MARRSVGVSGTALFLGSVGVYLAYIGVKDVPFVDGMRELFRQEKLTPRKEHSPYEPVLGGTAPSPGGQGGSAEPGPNDSGISQLKGNAKHGYSKIRPMGNWTIYGWGLRPSGNSDHPRGLAIDVMHTKENEAQQIIAVFKTLPGAKYWIWNRKIANRSPMRGAAPWAPRPYSGASPHTDHVHLSWS